MQSVKNYDSDWAPLTDQDLHHVTALAPHLAGVRSCRRSLPIVICRGNRINV